MWIPILLVVLWTIALIGSCIFLAINKKPSPIGYCTICKKCFYEPHAAHYTNVHKDKWQNVVKIEEKSNVK